MCRDFRRFSGTRECKQRQQQTSTESAGVEVGPTPVRWKSRRPMRVEWVSARHYLMSRNMSALFAIFTSDPNLLGCELHRSSDQVKLSEGGAKSAAGLGWYSPEDVLV